MTPTHTIRNASGHCRCTSQSPLNLPHPLKWLANVTPELETQEIGSVGAWTLYVDNDHFDDSSGIRERILAASIRPVRLTNALLYAHRFLEGEVPTDLIL